MFITLKMFTFMSADDNPHVVIIIPFRLHSQVSGIRLQITTVWHIQG